MSNKKIQFVTPRGRLVMGDLFKPETKNYLTGEPLTDRHGNPKVRYFFGVAIPKAEAKPVVDAIKQAAASGFPNGEAERPDFAWKYIDGDSTIPNMKNKRPCDREGFPGCYVFQFSTGFATQVVDANRQDVIDPNAVKRGDYVRVAATTVANGSPTKPGVYLNPSAVQVVAEGPAISTGIDVDAVFGDSPTAAPAAPPAPHDPTPAPPAPPAPPSGPQMSPSCPHTYEQLKGQGWTDDQMRAAGHLI